MKSETRKGDARKKSERRKGNARKKSERRDVVKGNDCRKRPEYVEKRRKFKRGNAKGNVKENVNKNRKRPDCKGERS